MCIRDRSAALKGYDKRNRRGHSTQAHSRCLMLAAVPVSYTHLDVYKRQPQGFVEGAAISVISLLILVLGIAGKAGLFSRHHRKM